MDKIMDKKRRRELVLNHFKKRLKKWSLKFSNDLPHWTNKLKTTSGACSCYMCRSGKRKYNRAKNKFNN